MILLMFKRFLGSPKSHKTIDENELPPEYLIAKIQAGDEKLRNQFITNYQPYVAKVTSQFCRRFIDPASDDEFTIALAAFDEAVNGFSSESGRSFLSFAETVIRRRLIDNLRKEQRHAMQIPYTSFEVVDDEGQVLNPIEIRQSLDEFAEQNIAEERRYEIIEFTKRLKSFGIQFNELVNISPKHADSRELLFSIGKMLSSNPEMMKTLIEKKQLPIKEMMDKVTVSRKTIERNRKYIITIALIWHGPYPYMREYLTHDQDQSTMNEGRDER